MRVLLAHNRYRSQSPSGEDVVYEQEAALLEAEGVEVLRFERDNDALPDSTLAHRLRAGASAVYAPAVRRELRALLRRERPDVAHFHNTFPQLSTSAYDACRDAGVPVVQTLHNFRLICAGAMLLRDGQPCEDCVGTSLLPGLLHRCYRGSLPATAAVVAMLAAGRATGAYRDRVHRYIALSDFAVERLAAGGLPRAKLCVKPNFVLDPPPPGRGEGGYAVFVGRCSAEKGLATLLEGWRHLPGRELRVIGDGPLRAALEPASPPGVSWLGRQPRARVVAELRDAVLTVVPSECYEGQPMVVLESLACGTPVVASDLGGLRELVDATLGTRFPAGDARALAASVSALWERASELRAAARTRFEARYSPRAHLDAVLQIYRDSAACAA